MDLNSFKSRTRNIVQLATKNKTRSLDGNSEQENNLDDKDSPPENATPPENDISTSSSVNVLSSDVLMVSCFSEDLNNSHHEYTELVPVHIESVPLNCTSLLLSPPALFESPSAGCNSYSPTSIFNIPALNVSIGEEQDRGTVLLSTNECNEPERQPNENEFTVHISADNQTHYEGENEADDDVGAAPTNTGRPKKGRKRKNPDQNRQQRKIKTITNQKYVDQRGKRHKEKEFRHYLCKCNCLYKVGEENIKREFGKFYSVASHDAQRALICAMVTEVEIKRKRVKNSNVKNNSRIYKVCGVAVCKNFFMQSFRISSCKINTALKTIKRPEGVRDMRGIAGGHNKINENRAQQVIDHIRKFPKYKSHYCRSTTDREFLSTDTTLAKMYELYKAEVQNPTSLSFYKHIFLTKFNLKRKTLKKDTCCTCDRLDVLITDSINENEIDRFKKEKEEHLGLAVGAQTKRNTDMKEAAENKEIETLCFDLQKTLPLPRIPTNEVYYKRQLCIYNLGIRSGKQQNGHCFVWVEGDAGRGSQEVGSCLRKFIMETVGRGVKKLILWSDSCGGQNRNIKIVLMLKSVVERHPTLETITFKYLFPGHSFLPNDSDFGDIESALKYQQRLYTPEDYITIMEKCRKKNPLIVHRMQRSDFVGTKMMEDNITNRKQDDTKTPINWLKTRVIEITKNEPYNILMKTSLEGEPVTLNIQKRPKRGRPVTIDSFNELCSPLWPNGKPLSIPKLNDLKSLMKYIPTEARTVYRNLIASAEIEDDIEGFNGALDFDIEEQE